jgi:hypothetical protein
MFIVTFVICNIYYYVSCFAYVYLYVYYYFSCFVLLYVYYYFSCFVILPATVGQASSVAEGAREANDGIEDGLDCGMLRRISRWAGNWPQNGERAFQRWSAKKSGLRTSTTTLPKVRINDDEMEEQGDYVHHVIWPHDMYSTLYKQGRLENYIVDDASKVTESLECFWRHSPELARSLNVTEPGRTIPVSWHSDGVKIYRVQKSWMFSFVSATRKGNSLDTRLVFTYVVENTMIKKLTFRAVAQRVAYAMHVLASGFHWFCDEFGKPHPEGSERARLAGTPIAGGYKAVFVSFRSDWEARYLIHNLPRHYSCNFICEHDLACKHIRHLTYGAMAFAFESTCVFVTGCRE